MRGIRQKNTSSARSSFIGWTLFVMRMDFHYGSTCYQVHLVQTDKNTFMGWHKKTLASMDFNQTISEKFNAFPIVDER